MTEHPAGSEREAGDGRSSPRRGAETRDAIDSAAVELFAMLGYHATSMRAIAAAAGVQPAAIYHWYPSKEAILIRLQEDFMDRLTADVVAAVDRQREPHLKLAAAVREHVCFHGRHRREAFVTDSEIRALEPQARAALIARRDGYQRRFHDLIDAGVAAGSLTSSNPDVATYGVLLQCTGVALWFDPDGPLSLDLVADLHVELVLGAVGASRASIDEAVESTASGTTEANAA